MKLVSEIGSLISKSNYQMNVRLSSDEILELLSVCAKTSGIMSPIGRQLLQDLVSAVDNISGLLRNVYRRGDYNQVTGSIGNKRIETWIEQETRRLM